MPHIKIILGTTRPQRFGIQPAEWITELAKAHPKATFELVDLKALNLPFLDEPMPPVMGNYQHDHTKEWAKSLDATDGFIFVTGEYNHGIPAPLKNAIDFAAKEWNYKPAAFVGYGAEAGGARAIEHLRAVLGWLRVYDLSDNLIIANYWGGLDEKGKYLFTPEQETQAHKLIDNVIFWSEVMEKARKAIGNRH